MQAQVRGLNNENLEPCKQGLAAMGEGWVAGHMECHFRVEVLLLA